MDGRPLVDQFVVALRSSARVTLNQHRVDKPCQRRGYITYCVLIYSSTDYTILSSYTRIYVAVI